MLAYPAITALALLLSSQTADDPPRSEPGTVTVTADEAVSADETVPADVAAEPLAALPPQAEAAAIPPEILEPLREDGGLKSWGIRADERNAYYFVLAHARKVGQARIAQAAREFADERITFYRDLAAGKDEPQTALADQSESAQRRARSIARLLQQQPDAPLPVFPDLFDNAERYLGRPVTLRGNVEQIIRFPAGENEQGFDELYEAWLYTDDSQHHPTVVICSEIPEGMPLGIDVSIDNVSASGYFFKMYGYDAQDTKRFAPLVLAHRLQWQAPPPPAMESLPSGIIFTVLALVTGAVMIAVWRARRADRQLQAARHARTVTEASLPAFDEEPHREDPPSP